MNALPFQLHWVDETPSTQDLALAAARDGAVAGSVWVADHQTAGRGRRAAGEVHTWFAPPGTNLTFSIVLRPDLPPGAMSGITLAAAVGCAEAIGRHCGVDVGIKWPNDLYVGGRKLGGILTEACVGRAIEAVIVGIGVNVNAWPSDFPAELSDVATSLAIETGANLPRQPLLEVLVAGVLATCTEFARAGDLSTLKGRWTARSVTHGRRVVFDERSVERFGVARGIDARGRLQIELEGGVDRWVGSGEVRFV